MNDDEIKWNWIELNELNEFSKGKNIKIKKPKKPKFGTFCGFLVFYKKPKKPWFFRTGFYSPEPITSYSRFVSFKMGPEVVLTARGSFGVNLR